MILAIFGLARYFDLQQMAQRQTANALMATAQSQLSLEFSRRILSNEDLGVDSQTICDQVARGSAGATLTLTCAGSLSDASIAITASVDGEPAVGTWINPNSGS